MRSTISPVDNINETISFIFHGLADTTVPITNVREYARLVNEAGGRRELAEYHGEQHAFFNLGKPSFADTIKKTDPFWESLGYLTK